MISSAIAHVVRLLYNALRGRIHSLLPHVIIGDLAEEEAVESPIKKQAYWTDQYCLRPLDEGPTKECWALKLPDAESCLLHISPTGRRQFFDGIRQAAGASTWPSDGYFAGLTIEDDLYQDIREVLREIPSSVNFRYSTFNTYVDFQGLQFGYVDFTGATFKLAANFSRTTFEGFVSFEDACFSNSGQSFSGAVFNGTLSFDCSPEADENTRQMVALHLSRAELAKDVTFKGRHFYHPTAAGEFSVFINDATVAGNLLFPDVVCDGTIVLDRLKLTAPIIVLAPRKSRVSLAEVRLTEPLTVTTSVIGQRSAMDLSEATQLTSLADATLEAPLTLGEGIALTRCRLVGSTGLDQVRITGTNPVWAIFRRRRIVADEILFRDVQHGHGLVNHDDATDISSNGRSNGSIWSRLTLLPRAEVFSKGDPKSSVITDPPVQTPQQVEAIYRQLRASLESSKAAPDAADFYYGEMEMRRLGSPRTSINRTLLMAYKLIGGYGLRAYRAVATYFVVILVISALLRYRTTWFVADPNKAAGSAGLSFTDYWDVFAIAARSSVSFISAVTDGLTAAGTLLFIGMRLIAPATLALAILALRARVQR